MEKHKKPQGYQGLVCPAPKQQTKNIILGHGSGGKLTHNLIKSIFMSEFDELSPSDMNDSAIINLSDSHIALTTDSHVVWPLFFSGGDIGRLAVCGTVNDLAMVGADPKFITAGFILEEGLDLKILTRVVKSMKSAADEANVSIVAGDTKVVQKGKADGLYITTSGFGIIPESVNIRGSLAQPGDQVILSGTLGDHGIAVLMARDELGFESDIKSDVSPLNGLVNLLLKNNIEIHVMRDPTRGGLATTLNEIAEQSKTCIQIDESRIPVKESVRAICEVLGFDPLYVANEGKFITIAPRSYTNLILEILKSHPLGKDAEVIGEVKSTPDGKVLLNTALGSTKILDMLSGEILPRIC